MTSVLEDHRSLAARTLRVMAVLAALLAAALLATGRSSALSGLAAGTAVGAADVMLLSRSLTRFGGGGPMNPRALGVGMLTRFLSIALLLGLMLSTRSLNPLATLVGFMLMPASVAMVGVWATRRDRLAPGAIDAVGS